MRGRDAVRGAGAPIERCRDAQRIDALRVGQAEGAPRVLLIASGDLWGGAEAHVYALVREFTRREGNHVRVLLFNRGLVEDRLRRLGVEVSVVDEVALGPVSMVRQIASIIRAWRPDIVHSHGHKECVLGTIAASIGDGRPACLRTVHGWTETEPRRWQLHKRMIRLVERLTLRRQAAVVAVSSELATRLADRLGLANVVTIENGIDADEVRQGRDRATGSVDNVAEYQVGLIGRLVPVKRVDLFLRVCHELQKKFGRRMRFWVIGDGPLMAAARQQVAELGLTPQTELPGFVNNVPDYLGRLDVLIICSDHEGLPIVLLEAMALGVPVVAHATGGIPKVLDSGNCGTLVPRQDVGEYVRAVTDVLQDRGAAARKAEAARTRLLEGYSMQAVATRYRQLYCRLSS